MFKKIAKAVLSPILQAQGKRVRTTVPILPEPEGDKFGEEGQGPELRILVTGDSSAAGVGVSHQRDALTGHIVKNLKHDYRVSWTLAATTGFTTRATLRMLKEMPQAPYDVAVISLGVNDTTRGLSVELFLQHQGQLMELLQSKFNIRHIIISGLPPMGKFPALPQPLRWAMGQHSRKLDNGLREWAATQPGCHYLLSDYTMDPSHMASDGFHPGAALYQMWGAAVAAQIISLRPQDH